MKKIKSYFYALIVMLMVSVICLWIVSMLAYNYKWQADKAMIGILVVYSLAGVTGGVWHKRMTKGTIMGAMLLGSLYIMLLLVASILIFENSLSFSVQFIRVYCLVICSIFMGRMLRK